MKAALWAHDGATHASDGSFWALISMIAVSLFLLAFAWALLRPSKPPKPTSADVATEQFARGNIDASDYERIVSDIRSRRS